MRVTVPGADRHEKAIMCQRRLCDGLRAHHEAVRGLPHGAAPLTGAQAKGGSVRQTHEAVYLKINMNIFESAVKVGIRNNHLTILNEAGHKYVEQTKNI